MDHGLKLLILRWKKAIQVVLPVAFTLDAIHNAWIMYRLYQGRVKDWEKERQIEIIRSIAPTLGRVSSHCQRKDTAFWPDGLSQAGRCSSASAADSSGAAYAGPNPFEQLGFGSGWMLAGVPDEPGVRLPASAHVHRQGQDRGRSEAEGILDAWAPDRLLRLAAEWCEAAAAKGGTRVEQALQAGIGAAQERLPVPMLHVSRLSALRVRVCFMGFSGPALQQAIPKSCELHLS